MRIHSKTNCRRVRTTDAASRTIAVGLFVSMVLTLAGCPSRSPTPPAALDSSEKSLPQPANGTESDQDVDAASSPTQEAPTASTSSEARVAQSGMAESTPEVTALPAVATEGTWTTQRLVALAPGGPVVIELRVSVDGHSLQDASRALTESLAGELFDGMKEPVTWQQLLERPVVQSGWLGNLVADAEQTDQLIGMYDTTRDDMVSLEELELFLTRGLARSTPLRVRDIGTAPGARIGASPWGDMDANHDYWLAAEELRQLPKVVSKLDVNGDAVLTREELQRGAMQSSPTMTNNRSLLDTSTLLVGTDASQLEEQDAEAARRKLANDLQNHYSYLTGIPRDQWRAWNDHRWRMLDKNEDELLTRTELYGISELAADCQLVIRFPDLAADSDAKVGVWVIPNESSGQFTQWVPSQQAGQAGQLLCGSCVLEVQLEDAYTAAAKMLLFQRLDLALRDANLRQFFRNQLQLNDDAFRVLDADEDQQLSEDEFERGWKWLTVRQGTRLLARWMTSAQPWFQLIDHNADTRLTEAEISRSVTELFQLDQDGDALLTPNELPLLVRLEIRRSDNRLDNQDFGLPAVAADAPPVDLDWFSAMDTNRDGVISKREFLGSRDDFERFDSDGGGFIDRLEAPQSQTP